MVIHIRNQQRSKNINSPDIRKALARALRILGMDEGELSIFFVNSRRMTMLNTRYRGIPRETDVLSFPMTGSRFPGGHTLLGDIVVSVPRAAAQARDYGFSLHDELLRLLVHGLLHLAGYDHEAGRPQQSRMERKERQILHAIASMD